MSTATGNAGSRQLRRRQTDALAESARQFLLATNHLVVLDAAHRSRTEGVPRVSDAKQTLMMPWDSAIERASDKVSSGSRRLESLDGSAGAMWLVTAFLAVLFGGPALTAGSALMWLVPAVPAVVAIALGVSASINAKHQRILSVREDRLRVQRQRLARSIDRSLCRFDAVSTENSLADLDRLRADAVAEVGRTRRIFVDQLHASGSEKELSEAAVDPLGVANAIVMRACSRGTWSEYPQGAREASPGSEAAPLSVV